MHRMHHKPRIHGGPETTGATIHWAANYDRLTRLLLGVNSPNSKMVIELANVMPGDSVLDVGCGTGNLTLTSKAYAGQTGQVYGIDASPEMIEVATKKASRLGSEVVFKVGLIEQLAFPDETFDVIISRLVMHHLPDELKRTGFAEMRRVLKPGGHLLITDFRAPTNPVLNHIMAALVGTHMMKTNTAHLPGMLRDAGFVKVSSGPTRSAFLAYVSGKKPEGELGSAAFQSERA